MSCRFYGMSGVVLRATGELQSVSLPGLASNECALGPADAHAPCEMEFNGAAPDDATCPRALAYLSVDEDELLAWLLRGDGGKKAAYDAAVRATADAVEAGDGKRRAAYGAAAQWMVRMGWHK
jgi:hypothetical protein